MKYLPDPQISLVTVLCTFESEFCVFAACAEAILDNKLNTVP